MDQDSFNAVQEACCEAVDRVFTRVMQDKWSPCVELERELADEYAKENNVPTKDPSKITSWDLEQLAFEEAIAEGMELIKSMFESLDVLVGDEHQSIIPFVEELMEKANKSRDKDSKSVSSLTSWEKVKLKAGLSTESKVKQFIEEMEAKEAAESADVGQKDEADAKEKEGSEQTTQGKKQKKKSQKELDRQEMS
eukprot:Nk52_evm74s215 gene=Nk52_evmTU74s215